MRDSVVNKERLRGVGDTDLAALFGSDPSSPPVWSHGPSPSYLRGWTKINKMLTSIRYVVLEVPFETECTCQFIYISYIEEWMEQNKYGGNKGRRKDSIC